MRVDMIKCFVLNTSGAASAALAVGTRVFAMDVLSHGAGKEKLAYAGWAVKEQSVGDAIVIDHVNELSLYIFVSRYVRKLHITK